MIDKNKYDWIDFYHEFALKLLEYQNDHIKLVDLIKQVFVDIDMKLPTLEKDNKLVDIDPFTVMGLFNKSSLKQENRLKIINGFAKAMGIKASVPVNFFGLPVLNNQNATFYKFMGERGDHDIDNLWKLFASAIKYSENMIDDGMFLNCFDTVIRMKGNGNSKVTMGLFWIAPNTFLNLDQRNEWYIYESGKMPQKIVDELPEIEAKISAPAYMQITERLHDYVNSSDSPYNDFLDLSYEAWSYSTEVNEQQKALRNSQGNALADDGVETIHYWIYAAGDNSNKWDEFYNRGVMAIGWHEIGDLSQYDSKTDMKQALKDAKGSNTSQKNSALAVWQFANEMKPGDIVFVKRGKHKIVGRGVVSSDYYFDNTDPEYPNIRDVNWTAKGDWDNPSTAANKTLTDITVYTEYVDHLCSLFDEAVSADQEEVEINYPEYSSEDFLEEVFMNINDYDTLRGLLRHTKNIILMGAPGVGKTFAAKRLAYSIIGVKDPNRVMMVQFHQSYSYEDFIEGYRPAMNGNGFEIKKGSFYNFCKNAADDSDNDYFFIIDEINRGNLSKIFGELFMLIEADKRGNSLQLLYSDEKFFVPQNVYIIGMMNTADRSLAMLDYALRRRFAFFEIKPGFESHGFRLYRQSIANDKFNNLIDCIERLNDAISSDESLGEGFCIGHSYFCNLTKINDVVLTSIVEYQIIPLIKEYWFDEPVKLRDWINNLRSSIK